MNNEKELEKNIIDSLIQSDFNRPDFKFTDVEPYVKFLPNTPVDIQATMYIKGEPYRAYFEVKNTERIAILRDAMRQIKQRAYENHAFPFLAGKFFSETVRQMAIQENIGLFDLAGNIYINHPLLHYERIITKNPFSKKPPLKDLFAPVASRVTRALLINKKKDWKFRELVEEAEVSIGLAHRIVERMIDDEYIQRNDGFFLQNPTGLLDAWKQVYPTYKQQRFSFFSYEQTYERVLAAIVNRSTQTYAFGFFTGADFIAPFIRGLAKAQLYVENREAVEKLQTELNLKRVESGGNVEIFIPYDKGVFYKKQIINAAGLGEVPVVSDLQLYMDLFNNPARGEEQAEHLRELKLKY